ncbi:uncharacterized protein B0H64DRAFT_419706 [Chaetomium fimeti]|uniref:RNase H type-1 domain-containing protein n=1 Tax=Chaetomium fimeti TaxID=1854472 RepID=A0AAE0LPB2_9PEZI|nr:hypothetical protein B0H64DRAFT_419706 [Chaetomium fimeti]
METTTATLPLAAAAPAHRPARRLTRHARVQPATIFHPQDPSLSPEAHFPLQTVSGPDRAPFPRFINRFDSREMLLVVDGSCVNNGRHANRLADPTGGWAFVFKGAGSSTPTPPGMPSHHHHHEPGTTPPNAATLPPAAGRVAFPLERHGPSGERAEPTSNRAKLRAVIGALQFRAWGDEGWRRVVVLTDLEYVVWGATRWLPRWVARRWRKPRHCPGGGRRYGNRDLWEELQATVEELRVGGCEVSFWLVRGGEVEVGDGGDGGVMARAKEAARRAARGFEGEEPDAFTKISGAMV